MYYQQFLMHLHSKLHRVDQPATHRKLNLNTLLRNDQVRGNKKYNSSPSCETLRKRIKARTAKRKGKRRAFWEKENEEDCFVIFHPEFLLPDFFCLHEETSVKKMCFVCVNAYGSPEEGKT